VGASFLEEHSWRLGASVGARAHSREEAHKLVEGCIQREEAHLACEGCILEEEAHILGVGTLLSIEGAIVCEGTLVGVGCKPRSKAKCEARGAP
jgi:hypothetical protein